MSNGYKIIQKSVINKKLLTDKRKMVEVPKSTDSVRNGSNFPQLQSTVSIFWI